MHHIDAGPPARPLAPACLVIGALACLMLGVLVYATRTGPQAALLEPWRMPRVAGLVGAAAAWLPSALHALCFGILSALCLPRTPRWTLAGCAAWGGIDALFEAGQHPAVSARLSALLAGLPGPIGQPLAAYFTRGTFDAADLAASLGGALVATCVIQITVYPHASTT